MAEELQHKLSRRERQIMDAIYQVGKATVAEVIERMPDPPSYSAVRAMLAILEEKGVVKHEQDGARYVYLPVVAREKARKSAMKNLLNTFFEGNSRDAIAALLDESKLSKTELDALSDLIEKAKKEGR